jgi:hypothetical protein
MKFRRRRACVAALVAIFALCVSGCSGGGGNHSSSTTVPLATITVPSATTTVPSATTTVPVVTTTVPFATTTMPTLRVEDLSVCPKEFPDVSQSVPNPAIDLTQVLVPIDALNVRLCKYGRAGSRSRLSGVSWLALSAAEAFASETNQLTSTTEPAVACARSVPSFSYFLTFAVDTETVDLYTEGCPTTVTNGAVTANVSPRWYSDLTRDANNEAIAPGAA